MYRLDDGTLVLSATDLTRYLACPHLIQQRLAIARGERSKPRPVDDPHAELIRARGDEHENSQLAALIADAGGDHLDLTDDKPLYTRAALQEAHDNTMAAMRAGRALISQGVLFDGQWMGRPDVLRRVPIASLLGEHAYEVLDMKLARQVKPQFVHQLSLYNRLLSDVQGLDQPVAYVLLGDGTVEQVHLRRYAALHRHNVAQLEELVDAPTDIPYPEPVAHCDFCELGGECRDRWVADDHLGLVAGARRDQRAKLTEVDITTVAGLGAADADHPRGELAPEQFKLLRHQAALQVESRTTRKPCHRHLEPEPECGYARLPQPDPADMFFDFEGDPYIGDSGIEYLWGWCDSDGAYDCVWAHDIAAERGALQNFLTMLRERWRANPGMHVYHYGAHEASKLKSLSVQYATCEDVIDELLRGGVLVDLYAVVRQGMQVGEESYSLKRLERHHRFRRLEKRVRAGGGSIVAYEQWLETRDEELREAIRAYNEEDCRSTLSLRDWLHGDMKPEAIREFGRDAFAAAPPEETSEPPKWMPEILELVERLQRGLPADSSEDDADEAERRLLSYLLLYHHREAKPEWWRYFDLCSKTPVELLDERDALAGLQPDPDREPIPFKRSLDHALTFPTQEFRLDLGGVQDPTTGVKYKLVAVGDDHIRLRCGNDKQPPSPAALIQGAPIPTAVLRTAIVDVAKDLLNKEGAGFRAIRALLRREPPRTTGPLAPDVDGLVAATLGLDRSVLPVQGPPGTGKTFRGARMVVEAIRLGRRVGVTAPSHAAIHNLLRDVEAYADSEGVTFRGVKKGDGYESAHGLIEVTDDNDETLDNYDLVAGTAWLFARSDWRDEHELDLLFVDEAGQFSLASAVAAGTAARSLVLLGDPQQLPQVTHASHPGTSGSSVLEHVLAGRATIPADRGVLLDESWRMHPEVCAFVSERSYDGLLRSREACGHRRIDATGTISGTGLRHVPVDHAGRSQASPEEADVIAAICTHLLSAGATVTDDHGHTRDLRPHDVMIVAPYNLAVRCIGERVPRGVRVGTVDKFQGQQAPIVFFSMTCSSGDDVPRGLDFLFSRNRLNVAISRAQCLALLVANPRLLDSDCRTLEQMELVDGACRFVEVASHVAPIGQLSKNRSQATAPTSSPAC